MAVLREEMPQSLVHGPQCASLVAGMSDVENDILTGFHTVPGFNEYRFG